MKPDKKIAIVTGGNRGLGFETSRQLAQAGILPGLGEDGYGVDRMRCVSLKMP